MNKEQIPVSENLDPIVEDAINEAFEIFRGDGKKGLSDKASDFSLHTEAGILKRLREAAIKYMKGNSGKFPDKVDLWSIVKKEREEHKNLPKKKEEEAGEVVETGGVI